MICFGKELETAFGLGEHSHRVHRVWEPPRGGRKHYAACHEPREPRELCGLSDVKCLTPRKDLKLLLCKFGKEYKGDYNFIINLINATTKPNLLSIITYLMHPFDLVVLGKLGDNVDKEAEEPVPTTRSRSGSPLVGEAACMSFRTVAAAPLDSDQSSQEKLNLKNTLVHLMLSPQQQPPEQPPQDSRWLKQFSSWPVAEAA